MKALMFCELLLAIVLATRLRLPAVPVMVTFSKFSHTALAVLHESFLGLCVGCAVIKCKSSETSLI